MKISGVSPLLASAIVATVPDRRSSAPAATSPPGSALCHGRTRAAARNGSAATKAGRRYLRQILIVGAMAVDRFAERNGVKRPWLVQLLARRKTKVAAVALANKNASMIWAEPAKVPTMRSVVGKQAEESMTTGESYREPYVA